MTSGLTEVTTALLVVFSVTAALLLIALLLQRGTRDMRDRRGERRRAAANRLLFQLTMADPRDADDARAAVVGAGRRDREVLERQAFGLLTKVRGAPRSDLRALLLELGGHEHAFALTGSAWSRVRRCRGAHRLGMLAPPGALAALTGLLDDRAVLVRRVAIRSLGSLGDPAATPVLVAHVESEPRLRGDVVAALVRIGPDACPELRDAVASGLAAGRDTLGAEVAAQALGLLTDIGATDLLLRALRSGRPRLAEEAAGALGVIGAPEAARPLVARLDDGDARLRTRVAEALGRLGASEAVPRLGALLDDGDRTFNRTAAAALLRLGIPGDEALRASPSPYAAEALAVADLVAGRSAR